MPPSQNADNEVALVVWPISNKNASTECWTIHVRTKRKIHTAWFLTSLAVRNLLENLATRVAIVVLEGIKISIVGDPTVGVLSGTHDEIAIATMTGAMIVMTVDDFFLNIIYIFGDIARNKNPRQYQRKSSTVHCVHCPAPLRRHKWPGLSHSGRLHLIRPSVPPKIHNALAVTV